MVPLGCTWVASTGRSQARTVVFPGERMGHNMSKETDSHMARTRLAEDHSPVWQDLTSLGEVRAGVLRERRAATGKVEI
jgi:hypothetical protein